MTISELKTAGSFQGFKQKHENITIKKQEKYNADTMPETVVYSVYNGKGEGKCIAVTPDYAYALGYNGGKHASEELCFKPEPNYDTALDTPGLMTFGEFAKTLPLQKRLQYLENIRIYCKTDCANFKERLKEKGRLMTAFGWSETRQGGRYWCRIHDKYEN